MKHSEEVVEIRTNKRLDPNRSHLRRLLEAQFAYEWMSNARSILIHLLAISGVLLWVEALWPELASAQAHSLTLLSWGCLLFLTVGVAVEEYILWRKLASHLARQNGASVRHD
jgi:hypothetical protein